MTKVLMTVFLLVSLASGAWAGKNVINFEIDSKLLASSPVYTTVGDVRNLLEQSFTGWTVTVNGPRAGVNIRLELNRKYNNPTARVFPSSIFYPVQFYMWKAEPSKEGSALILTSPGEMGLVFGLYGLLQEKLGFRFYHPKDTYIPQYSAWPLPENFTFEGQPRFDKRGFHLHTMHPMELTEQLHGSMDGTALDDVKEYIDWLVRNGQNVMQFWLLRTVDRDTWPDYARRYVEYAKERGVLTGVVVSLSTLQQKAFQMINLLRPHKSFKHQIDENLAWLMQVPFDFVSIDFTMGEYLPDLSVLLPWQKKYLIDQIKNRYGVYVMENTHVIKRKESNTPESTGKIIHSVMFYSLSDKSAPVYGNKNQRFMFDMMKKDKQERETWYWPESSYWVTFDTSVPLFLLPYLKSRYDDIMLISKEGIDGHVTFTSGWEWGYWMIDYSIARWTWKFSDSGHEEPSSPMSVLDGLFDKADRPLFEKAMEIQEKYLKDEKLISLLSAKTPFEELPWPFNRSFQPTFGYSMVRASIPYIGRKDREKIDESAKLLESFYTELSDVISELEKRTTFTGDVRDKLRRELLNALEITALRAKHRHFTLLAAAYRNYNLKDSSKFYVDSLLKKAEQTRLQAMQIVRSMEREYRYPVALIARRMHGHTAYDFGYLYPVSDLFFWQREEKQVARTRFDAFYMNLWDFWDTLGLDGLFK